MSQARPVGACSPACLQGLAGRQLLSVWHLKRKPAWKKYICKRSNLIQCGYICMHVYTLHMCTWYTLTPRCGFAPGQSPQPAARWATSKPGLQGVCGAGSHISVPEALVTTALVSCQPPDPGELLYSLTQHCQGQGYLAFPSLGLPMILGGSYFLGAVESLFPEPYFD